MIHSLIQQVFVEHNYKDIEDTKTKFLTWRTLWVNSRQENELIHSFNHSKMIVECFLSVLWGRNTEKKRQIIQASTELMSYGKGQKSSKQTSTYIHVGE
jgi:hypothetical protein